jgi:hypothetical protein
MQTGLSLRPDIELNSSRMVKKSGRAEGDPAGFLTQVIVRVWSVLTWEWETVLRVAERVWSKNPAGPKATLPDS